MSSVEVGAIAAVSQLGDAGGAAHRRHRAHRVHVHLHVELGVLDGSPLRVAELDLEAVLAHARRVGIERRADLEALRAHHRRLASLRRCRQREPGASRCSSTSRQLSQRARRARRGAGSPRRASPRSPARRRAGRALHRPRPRSRSGRSRRRRAPRRRGRARPGASGRARSRARGGPRRGVRARVRPRAGPGRPCRRACSSLPRARPSPPRAPPLGARAAAEGSARCRASASARSPPRTCRTSPSREGRAGTRAVRDRRAASRARTRASAARSSGRSVSARSSSASRASPSGARGSSAPGGAGSGSSGATMQQRVELLGRDHAIRAQHHARGAAAPLLELGFERILLATPCRPRSAPPRSRAARRAARGAPRSPRACARSGSTRRRAATRASRGAAAPTSKSLAAASASASAISPRSASLPGNGQRLRQHDALAGIHARRAERGGREAVLEHRVVERGLLRIARERRAPGPARGGDAGVAREHRGDQRLPVERGVAGEGIVGRERSGRGALPRIFELAMTVREARPRAAHERAARRARARARHACRAPRWRAPPGGSARVSRREGSEAQDGGAARVRPLRRIARAGSASSAPATAGSVSTLERPRARVAVRRRGAGAVGPLGAAVARAQPGAAPHSMPAGQHAMSCARLPLPRRPTSEPRRQDQQQDEARALAAGERHGSWV